MAHTVFTKITNDGSNLPIISHQENQFELVYPNFSSYSAERRIFEIPCRQVTFNKNKNSIDHFKKYGLREAAKKFVHYWPDH